MYEEDDKSDKFDLDLYMNPEGSKEPKSILDAFADDMNIADKLDDELLHRIGMRVLVGAQEDMTTQAKWMLNAKEAQRLALLEREPKNTPLPQSASIKLPLITEACYQYSAHTYPELVKDGKVVKGQVIGEDADGTLSDLAELVSIHMSYQLLDVDSSWAASMDKLLILLANIGCVFKKTYYDPIKKKNVSIVCDYKDIIVRNDQSIHCLDDLRRITHVLYMHPNDLVEGSRYGIYKESAVEQILHQFNDIMPNPVFKAYEQHCFYDLDDDGYEEPYVVTVDANTGKVIRIVARYEADDIERNKKGQVKCIKITQYFTDFHFLPSPDGSFLSLGYGMLLLHLNDAANTILNQLIDAGSLANLQGGFIDSRLKFMGGQTPTDPGCWIKTKGVPSQLLKDGFMPHMYKEPSSVLFQLLGLLIQTAEKLTNTTEAMSGTNEGQNTPAATSNNMVAQGMKPFIAIQYRVYRSLDSEFQKLFALNKKYLQPEEFFNVVGQNLKISDTAYKTDSIRVIPVADPNLSSDGQRLSKLNFLLQLTQNPAIAPNLNIPELVKMGLKWINIPNPDSFIVQPEPQPNPDLIKIQAQSQAKQGELAIKKRQEDRKDKEFAVKVPKTDAEISQIQSAAVKSLAQANKIKHDAKTADGRLALDTIKAKNDMASQAHAQMTSHNVEVAQMQQKQQEMNQQHEQAMTGLQQDQQEAEAKQEVDQNAQSGQQDQSTDGQTD